MREFKISDFVQVEYTTIDPDGVTEQRWRNALYTGSHSGGHTVIYANGHMEVLNNQTQIRAAAPVSAKEGG